MTWVVDTAVLIDVLEDGLTLCPVTYVELAPAFEGQRALREEFLTGVGVRFTEGWTPEDTLAAFHAWNAHVRRRRRGEGSRRPIADLLIGAFSLLSGSRHPQSGGFPDGLPRAHAARPLDDRPRLSNALHRPRGAFKEGHGDGFRHYSIICSRRGSGR